MRTNEDAQRTFMAITVASECTLLSVRLLRLHPTCGMQAGGRWLPPAAPNALLMSARTIGSPCGRPLGTRTGPAPTLEGWPRLEARMPPALKMASSSASSTVSEGAVTLCICRPAQGKGWRQQARAGGACMQGCGANG